MELSKSAHDYGQISLNSTATFIVDVSNDSDEPITITGVSSTNSAFSVSPYSNVQEDEAISAGITRTMTINFQPTEEIVYSGTLTLQTDSAVTPEISIDLPRDHFLNTYPQKQNLSLASAWLKNQGIAEDIIVDALLDYKPEPHRLSKVCSIDEVKFWNDSKSTNLGSVISACKSFPAKIIWIGGGKSKGEDLGEYARSLKPYVSHAFLFGESSTSLHQCMTDAGIFSTISRSLGEAVSQAYDAAQKAVDILFSPGFASFDHFKNYLERGNSFIRFVLDLKNTVLKGTQEGSHFHTPSRKLLV